MPKDAFGHSQLSSRTPIERDAVVAYSGFSTRAIRVGQDPDAATGATIVPVYQTATFTQVAVGQTKGFDYSRSGNPTRTALEAQLASLEDARFGCAFGSGMAAVFGAVAPLRANDHILATKEIYGGTHRLFSDLLSRYNIETTYVDMTDLDATRAAIRPSTKLFWIETPTNPLLTLIDIRAIAALKSPGQILAVDNTFATPYLQRPLALGADIVMHSTTKYITGHSDVVGGVVITDSDELHKEIAFSQNAIGAVPGAWDAYLTLRGAKTLAVRMREHERNAAAVAAFLGDRGDVETVYYPGLDDHPQHELAKLQMSGFGGVVSARLRGAERACEFMKHLRIFNLATSLGGVESLVCSPTVMTHGPVPRETKLALGITDDLVRFSVGIEDQADILADLRRALDATEHLAEHAYT
jgi:cystathionine beta-lyase/cystathionine gamma-synthase